MNEMPVIELHIRDMGQQIHSALMLHHQEIERYITEGVERAMRTIGEQIVQQACEEASKQVYEHIKRYFTWGDGAKAIQKAVTTALEPIAVILAGEAGPKEPR